MEKNRSRLNCKPNLAVKHQPKIGEKLSDLRPIFTSPSRQVAKSIRKQVSFGGCSKHWDRFVTGIWRLAKSWSPWVAQGCWVIFLADFCWVSLQHLDALGRPISWLCGVVRSKEIQVWFTTVKNQGHRPKITDDRESEKNHLGTQSHKPLRWCFIPQKSEVL
jgi:hypothetical protein